MPVNWLWSRLEQPVTDVRSLRTRNLWLAWIHIVLFAASVATLVLIAAQLKLLVTLSQRSNIETLTLAIVAAIALFMIVSTLETTMGSVLLLYCRALPADRAQRWLQRRAYGMRKADARFELDTAVRGPAGGVIEIPIEDDHGRVGTVRLGGTEISVQEIGAGAASGVAQIVVEALGRHGSVDGLTDKPHVVFWNGIEEDASRAYHAGVVAFTRLEEALESDALWPRVSLTDRGVKAIEETLRQAASAIREDLLLPDNEYSADFSVPIVPQPLNFVQLRRQAQRADPVAAMGCSALMAIFFLLIVAYVIVDPPWVPGR